LRSVQLYDPKIYSIILVKLGFGKDKDLLELMKKQVSSYKDIKMDISFKSEWATIELQKSTSESEKDFSDVSPELMKMKYDDLNKIVKKIREDIQPLAMEGCDTHVYNLFTTGTKDNAWLKTYSDMTFFFKDKKSDPSEILQTNIAYLNRILNSISLDFIARRLMR